MNRSKGVFVFCFLATAAPGLARVGESYVEFQARVGKPTGRVMSVIDGTMEARHYHRKEAIRIMAYEAEGKIAGEVYTNVTQAEAEVIMEQQAGGAFKKLRFNDNRIVWGIRDLHAFYDSEAKQLYVSTNAVLEKVKGFAAWEATQFREETEKAAARIRLKSL